MIPFHPLADIFPLIQGDEFKELVQDIQQYGLRERIVVLGNEIIDGRNRYRACIAAGLIREDAPPMQTVHDLKYFCLYQPPSAPPPSHDDLVAYVISKNLRRRQLNESQRAQVAARLGRLRHGGDRSKPSIEGLSTERRASMLSVSRASVERAESVEDDGISDLQRAVETGQLRISTAAMIARLPKEEQVRLLQEAAPQAVRAAAKELNARKAESGRLARRALQKALSDKTAELSGNRKYAAIYFDPPWHRKQGITDRSYENHYPTMTWGEIIDWALSMRDRLLEDAWGFMWIPRAHLFATHPVVYDMGEQGRSTEIPTPLPWAIAVAMGFNSFSTCFIWTKTDEEHVDEAGMGILVRDQDEILLMFKKGRGNPKPATNEIFGSNHRERSRPLGHSRKPQFYREMIAKMVGDGVPVLECFARHDENFPLPNGWDVWGNQSQPGKAA